MLLLTLTFKSLLPKKTVLSPSPASVFLPALPFLLLPPSKSEKKLPKTKKTSAVASALTPALRRLPAPSLHAAPRFRLHAPRRRPPRPALLPPWRRLCGAGRPSHCTPTRPLGCRLVGRAGQPRPAPSLARAASACAGRAAGEQRRAAADHRLPSRGWLREATPRRRGAVRGASLAARRPAPPPRSTSPPPAPGVRGRPAPSLARAASRVNHAAQAPADKPYKKILLGNSPLVCFWLRILCSMGILCSS